MSSPVAVITGGSSGIGLALTKHLLEKSWKVVIADVNPPKEDLPEDRVLYVKTDVSSWDQQASTFKQAFEWGGQRLDFAALNAGVDDRDDIFSTLSPSATTPPQKPNMFTFDVNLTAVYYGIKLASHYFTHNTHRPRGGKIVVTASAAALYPSPSIPQYAAAKAALVQLTRCLAPQAAEHGITINNICPAMVATGLAPPGLLDRFPKEHMTPMSTILRAFDELTATGEQEKNGQTVECTLDELHYRMPVEYANESQAWMPHGAKKFWEEAYGERNKSFAASSKS